MILIPNEHLETIQNGLSALEYITLRSAAWDERRGQEVIAIRSAKAALEQPPSQGKCMCGCDACKYCEQLLETEQVNP